MNGKIAGLQQELNSFEKKISFYEEKYRNVNRKINIDEINEIRDNILMRKTKEKNEAKQEKRNNIENSSSNTTNSTKETENNEENSQKIKEITDENLNFGSEASLEMFSL